MCYHIAGKPFEYVNVYDDIEQRNYFSFYNYEYYLDVSRQYELISDVKPLYMGLRESFDWYTANSEKVIKKPFFDYIDKNLRNLK